MADDEGKRIAEMSDHPNLAHMLVLTMEELSDKLKLLGYEKGFCKQLHFKPISRHYFALSTNPGEQFHYFTNLAVWLIRKCGKNLEQPQEADDPNATIATILDASRKLGLSIDFAPAKLKPGFGHHVCVLLNEIAGCAMVSAKFNFKRPVIREDNVRDEVMTDDNDEVRISRLDEEIVDEGGEDSDGGGDDGTAFLDFTTSTSKNKTKQGLQSDLVVDMLQPSVDSAAWQMEVERVLPHLKVTLRSDHRDWRSHYEQLHQHKDNIDELFTANKGQLDKLSTDIAKTLEKIASREKYINGQLEHQIEEYRTCQNRLAEEREHYKQGSSSVNDLTLQLQQISEELETVKAQMDEKGTSMTDAGPLVRIKQALTKLKAECLQMDLKAAVVEHTLLDSQVKSKSAMHRRMNTTMPIGELDVEY